MADGRLGDLFFGIEIGSDSTEVIQAMTRRGWSRSDVGGHMGPQQPGMFFVGRGGYDDQLATGLSGNEVTSITRMWTRRSSDTVFSWKVLDSLRSAFDRWFPKVDHRSGNWIVATEPDTVFLSLQGSGRRTSGERYTIHAGLITAHELRRLRAISPIN